MSKPYTQEDLAKLFDEDLIWRRKELSDMKAAVRAADAAAKPVLLRAIIAMSYAHWEGFVRVCAQRYFEHLSLPKKPYSDFERQVYVNTWLARLDALRQGRVSLEAKCELVNEILDGTVGTFRHVNASLIDTKSNLNTDVIKEICLVCSVDSSHFEASRKFIDQFVLKRRNAIAHGQQEFVHESEIDKLVAEMLSLMEHFRNLLENKIVQKGYAVAKPVALAH